MNSKISYNFLNLYWARPEVAIWRSLDALQMKDVSFKKPFLDLCCGDGTFTFTLFGGKVSLDFDVYKSIKSTSNFWKGRDIHNQQNVYKPKIVKKSRRKVDYGLDWKQNLLNKADSLGLYDNLIKHNLNNPLPFSDNRFNSIFSNVFYWIDNLEQLIKESYRILNHNGILVVCVPDIRFRENLIFNYYLKKHYRWSKELDRGIYANISKHCYSYHKWRLLFTKFGFKIIKHSTYLSENLIKFWNIGMRPYSPYLIEMANGLKKDVRLKIKSRLLREITPIIDSYVSYELNSNTKNCFRLFVLQKV